MNKQVLLVDDDKSLLKVMEYHIKDAGYAVVAVSSAEEGLQKQRENFSSVVITDIQMPDMDGISFLKELRTFDTKSVVLVITGHPSVDVAVDAMKAGAFDFIQKPVSENQLRTVLKKAYSFYKLSSENSRLKELVQEKLSFGNMIGQAPKMQALYKEAERVAKSNITTLILGETGAGKEVLAKAIHVNSKRSEEPFVAINCAAIPPNLIESELFGHVKGSFTGANTNRVGLIEEANGGTFFMDEIGDLPLELQPKLLRVLQEKEFTPVGSNKPKKVDIRFIGATHRDVKEMVQEGTFREDLYFRLNVISLIIPPVRERKEDIILLFKHFLDITCKDEGREPPTISKEVVRLLENYDWPGNVREIQNIAARCAVLSQENIIKDDLPFTNTTTENKDVNFSSPYDLDEYIDDLYIDALTRNDWNQSKTARFLNISRNTLVYRLKREKLVQAQKEYLQNKTAE